MLEGVMTKEQWIENFRDKADSALPAAMRMTDRNKRSDEINKTVKRYLEAITEQLQRECKAQNWTNEQT